MRRPSAVATLPPRWRTVPSHRTGPVSSVIGRTRLTLTSSVVYASPTAMVVWTAQPIAESRIVIANPPWTTPIGLNRCSPASPTNVTLPSSAVPPVKPIVAVIGGDGSVPSKIARMNLRPLRPAPRLSASIGSSHVIVRVRAFVSTSFIRSHCLLELDRVNLNRRGAEAPDGGRSDRACERQARHDLPAGLERAQHHTLVRRAQHCDEDGHAQGGAELARHAVDGAARRQACRWKRRSHGAREGRNHEPDSGAARSEEHTSELQSHLNLVCRLLLE